MTWVLNNLEQILELSIEHVRLSILPIVLGFVIAIPLGWVAWRYRLTRGLILTLVGLLYTIPSLALFVILPPLLGLPFLGPLNSVEFTGSSARGQRQGVECTQDLAASLPAVLSITERTGEARFPKFKGIMTAKRKPVVLYKAADLGLGGISHAEGNLVLASSKRPARGAGTKIVDDGNAAAQLADYLSNENLI